MKQAKKKIFLSHAFLDRKIADKIVEKLLIPIFGLDKTKDVFYTSKRDTGIRSSVNWKNNIKENLADCEIFVVLITPNFKKSEMCLGEIGAAWILNKTIYPLILPPIKHEDFSVVISEFQADVLMKREDLNMFINSLQKDLNKYYQIDKKVEDSENYVTKFLKSLRSYKRKNPHLFEERVIETEAKDIEPKINSSDLFQDSGNENQDIINRSKEKWPDDYSMQEYEINEQMEALTELRELRAQHQKNRQITSIINRSIRKWQGDYSMQVYEAKEQINAYNRL